MDERLQWVVARIIAKVTPAFFGKLTIAFEAGKPVRIEWSESEKPPKE